MKRVPLKYQLLAAETELKDLGALFDLQHKRSLEADKMWQADTGEKYIPDLGRLLQYFMDQRALLLRLHALLTGGGYGSDEYAEIMESIEQKRYAHGRRDGGQN
jgi:hypothetical protein